jgi:hypothetical protein
MGSRLDGQRERRMQLKHYLSFVWVCRAVAASIQRNPGAAALAIANVAIDAHIGYGQRAGWRQSSACRQ